MALTIDWSYLQNPFDNVTKKSHKRMLIMARDHFDKLKQKGTYNPDIMALYDWGKPAFDEFVKQYEANENIRAQYKRYTMQFQNLINELMKEDIRRWDIEIQFQFDEKSPEYSLLLSNGRKPFQSGAYETRLSAVNSFSQRLLEFPQLSSLQEKVANFAQQLEEARSKQQHYEGEEQDGVDRLEQARIQLAKYMHGIYGSLLRIHFENPALVGNYYELKYLRSKRLKEDDAIEIESETLSILPNSYAKSFEDQLETNQQLRITNNGRKDLVVYLSAAVQEDIPESAVTVHANQYVTLTVGQDDTMLVILNQMDVDGECVVEIIGGEL